MIKLIINIPHSPIWMSVDEHWHSLCGSGAVDSVSIGDRVELDRLWLPSLLHVTHKEPAGAPTNTRACLSGWKPAEKGALGSNGQSQVTRHGLTDEDTQRRSVTDILLLMGGCEWCGRWNVTKNIYIRLPDSMVVLGTAPPLLAMGGIAMLCRRGVAGQLLITWEQQSHFFCI